METPTEVSAKLGSGST